MGHLFRTLREFQVQGRARSFRQWNVGEFLDFAAGLPALAVQCHQAIGGRRVF